MVGIVDVSIPLAAITGIIAVILVIAYLEYKKNMAMIERGIIPEGEKEKKHDPESKLAWGIATLGIGLSLLIGWRFNVGGEFTISLIFISIGIGLLVAYFWKKTK